MKPARCGGLTEARKQIEIVQRAGLMFLGSGLTDPDLSLAASLVLYGAYDLKYPAALNGPQFLAGSILKQPFEVKNGELSVPTGPGLGVEVDEAKLHRLIVKDV
jgi:muconate cycloisomerase